ncbi:MAG: hypothetical protein LBT74_07355, partial [Acidobacteriota bacterium]|nr:hypothetical protein [Acidobacteriota bacterium]
MVDFSTIAPVSVVRFFKSDDAIDFIYVSTKDMQVVPQVSAAAKALLIGRHRNQSFYRVDNLAAILDAANKISLGLTLVLLVIAMISLVSSGISIMNVMLITVTERTREIGVKKALGALRRVLLTEFLVEANQSRLLKPRVTPRGCRAPPSRAWRRRRRRRCGTGACRSTGTAPRSPS